METRKVVVLVAAVVFALLLVYGIVRPRNIISDPSVQILVDDVDSPQEVVIVTVATTTIATPLPLENTPTPIAELTTLHQLYQETNTGVDATATDNKQKQDEEQKEEQKEKELKALSNESKLLIQRIYSLEQRLEEQDEKRRDFSGDSQEEIFTQLFRDIHRVTHQCKDLRHVGGEPGVEGVWAVCFDNWERYKDDCVVYSFGSNNDFTFEDGLLNLTNCKIHTFDPTMGVKSHQRTDRNWFWDVGISDTTRSEEVFDPRTGLTSQWRLATLTDIMKGLGHTNIWLIKIDVEYAEWPSLRQMFQDHNLDQVSQLILEVHFGYSARFEEDRRLNPLKQIFSNWLVTMLTIRELGFQLFYHHANPIGPMFEWGDRIQTSCCYEVYYIKPYVEAPSPQKTLAATPLPDKKATDATKRRVPALGNAKKNVGVDDTNDNNNNNNNNNNDTATDNNRDSNNNNPPKTAAKVKAKPPSRVTVTNN